VLGLPKLYGFQVDMSELTQANLSVVAGADEAAYWEEEMTTQKR